jgi:PTS system nitrogen regulatory IIA component
MVISEFLAPADVLIDVQASDKTRLLRDLSAHAASALGLGTGVIASALLKREALGSTGVGRGVAIPHARIAELKKPYGVLARLKEPIGFDAVDDHPVDVVFVVLLPVSSEAEQLNALACVARKLHDPSALLAVREAADSAALRRAVTT